MSKTPTAEEMEQSGEYDSYQDMMRAYARMHVKAALEAASEKAKCEHVYNGRYAVDKESVLSSYPLNNIQ